MMQITTLKTRFEAFADCLRSPLLLVLRLYWGWQFVQAGWGKFMHLDRTASFFRDLGIPVPMLNAILASGTELVGGLLLLLGLWARIASVPLVFTMGVAYATAERAALQQIASNPEKFVSAAPFLFLLVSLVILAFGPGTFSVDRLLRSAPGADANKKD